MGLLRILPACLNDICNDFGYKTILNGIDLRGFGSSAVIKLTTETRDRALKGFLSLQEEFHATTYICLSTDKHLFTNCYSTSNCDHARKHIFQWLFTAGPMVRGLDRWEDWYGSVFGADQRKLCYNCQQKPHAVRNEGRQQIWNSLPAIFGLSPCTELLTE